MAIEKSLYQAPQGIDEGIDDDLAGALEIDILNPEEVTLSDGSVEVSLMPDVKERGDNEFNDNLAEELDKEELEYISHSLLQSVESDVHSRKEWADTYVDGLDILGFKYEERTEPWENACGVYSTVLAEQLSGFKPKLCLRRFLPLAPLRLRFWA